MNDSRRLLIATRVLQGICAGDWKFDIPEGSTWPDVATKRALELADKMLENYHNMDN